MYVGFFEKYFNETDFGKDKQTDYVSIVKELNEFSN
jgi:hypothetical protein